MAVYHAASTRKAKATAMQPSSLKVGILVTRTGVSYGLIGISKKASEVLLVDGKSGVVGRFRI